jgi:hypothetical protein
MTIVIKPSYEKNDDKCQSGWAGPDFEMRLSLSGQALSGYSVVFYGYTLGLFQGYSRVIPGLFWVFKYLKAQNNPKILLASA